MRKGKVFLTKRVTACKWKVMFLQVVGSCVVLHGKFNLYRLIKFLPSSTVVGER